MKLSREELEHKIRRSIYSLVNYSKRKVYILSVTKSNMDKIIRIKYETFRKLVRDFPPLKGESMSHYFKRVQMYIEASLK